MSEQEEGRLRSAATTAVVVVDQQASQAGTESRNKQEQCEPCDQKWSKLSDIPLPKDTQVATNPRSLHVPDLKNFENIELTEMGSGSTTVDTAHQYVETTFAMKMENSEPIVSRAIKHFETTFPVKMGSDPIIKCVERNVSSKMETDHGVPLVVNRLEPTPATIFMNAIELESSCTPKPSEPFVFESKPTTRVSPSSEKASDPIPLEMKSTMTTLPLEQTSELSPLEVKPTMTKLSRCFDNTFEPISVGVKSTTTKVLLPMERASDPIPLEIKSTMTTLTLREIAGPVPLEVKSTMTTLTLDKTIDPIPSEVKSTETKVLLPDEKTESIPLKSTITRVAQALKKKIEESEKDDILEDNAVQSTCQETRVTDWEETNESQKRQISWNDYEYLDKVQLQVLSEAKLVPLQDAPATCSRVDLPCAKPCGITLSLIPQRSLTYFNNTAKTGLRIAISKGSLAGSKSQFTISQIEENVESENIPAMESTEQFSTMPHCLGILRDKIDIACNKIIQYFTK